MNIEGMVNRLMASIIIPVFLLLTIILFFEEQTYAGGYVGICGITGGAQDDTGETPHRGCRWGPGCDTTSMDEIMIYVGVGADCADNNTDDCTFNVDFFDAVTGKFLRNENIGVGDCDGGGPPGPPCNLDELNTGDQLCGPSGQDAVRDDCGDGSSGRSTEGADRSCGCNPEEGDEGCCYQKSGHSVYYESGFYTRKDHDLTIVGNGVDINIDRYYNSNRSEIEFRLDRDPRYIWRAQYPSFLGYGWRHRYQERIRILLPQFFNGYEADPFAEMLNQKPVIYYRSDGVATKYRFLSTNDKWYADSGRDQLVREGNNIVIVKPSGERHVFEIQDGDLANTQPVDIRLRRIEAYKPQGDGDEVGGIDLLYCDDTDCNNSSCPERDLESIPYLCKIIIDDSNGQRGVVFKYDQGRLSRLMSTDSSSCIVQYGYDIYGNLTQVMYQDGRGPECEADGVLQYDYEIGTEDVPAPVEAFTCKRLANGECEWICGEDENGNCLPLWRVCDPPENGVCKPWCINTGGECKLIAGMGICPLPDDGGNCQDGCTAVPELDEGGVCISDEDSTECSPPRYKLCDTGCHLDSTNAITSLICVPEAEPLDGLCSHPGGSYLLKGFWGEESLCAYSEAARAKDYSWLDSVRDEDGIRLEGISYVNWNHPQVKKGTAIAAIKPDERQTYHFPSDNEVQVLGYAFGHWPILNYSVNFMGDREVIYGNCGCGPVREIGWGKVRGRRVVKWMKSGETGTGDPVYTVYEHDEQGRTTKAYIGTASNNEDLASQTILPEGQIIDYEYDNPERMTPTSIKLIPHVGSGGDSACGGICPTSETIFDYGGQDRIQRIIRKGCGIVASVSGTHHCDTNMAEVTTIGYLDGKVDTIDGPRDDVEDIIKFIYYTQGPNSSYLNKIRYMGSGLDITYSDYNMFGKPKHITDFNGNVWGMEYDGRGRLISFRKPDSGGENQEYTIEYENGRLSRVVLPKGNVIEYGPRELGIDIWGLVQTVQRRDSENSAAKETARQEVAFRGLLAMLSYVGAGGSERYRYQSFLETEWDTSGIFHWIMSMTDDGNLLYRIFHYDELGNLSEMWDEAHPREDGVRTLAFENDGLNRISGVEAHTSWEGDEPFHQRKYGYDMFGGLQKTIDFGNKTTKYLRDGFSRISKIESLDTGDTYLAYDAAGNLIERWTALGTTSYSYDSLSRLVKVLHDDGTSILYCYDETSAGDLCPSQPDGFVDNLKGHLRAVVDGSGTTYFSYRSDGLLEKERHEYTALGIEGISYDIVYDYDANGNLKSTTYPSGRTLSYVYDTDDYGIQQFRDRPIKVRVSDGNEEQLLASNIEYEPFGPVRQYDLGNGIRRQNEYDNKYRTDYTLYFTVGGRSYSNHTYSYDEVSNISYSLDIIKTVSETYDFSYGYSYDPLHQLTAAMGSASADGGSWEHGGTFVENYFLDPDGNRDFLEREDKTFAYLYDPLTCADYDAASFDPDNRPPKTSNRITCIADPVFDDEQEGNCDDEDPQQNQHGHGHEKGNGRGHHSCAPYGPPGQTKKNDKDGDGVPDNIDLTGLGVDFHAILEELRDLLSEIPLGDLEPGDAGWKKNVSRRYNSIVGRINAIMNRYGLHQRVIRRLLLGNVNFHRLLAKLLNRRAMNGPRWTSEDRELVGAVIDAAEAVDIEVGVRQLGEEGLILTPVEYDGVGNMVRKGSVCYQYGSDNRLARVGLLPPGIDPLGPGAGEQCTAMIVVAEFAYDAWGRRTNKTVMGVPTVFAYDGAGQLIAEGLPGGLWTTEYYYLGGQPLSMWKGLAIPAVGAVPGCSTSAGHAMTGLALILLPFGLALVFWRRRAWRLCLVLLLSGGVVACAVMVSTCRPNDGPNGGVPYTFGGGYFYYHNDYRGAPLYMTDEYGKIVWLARYRPYGEIDEDRDVDGDGLPVENNLRYPGQYDDRLDELLLGDKLYYNMNRYYDPGMGRYISPEVEERLENIDTNNFTYAMSNPLSYIDRNALDPFGGDGEADMWRQVLGLATNDEIVREQTYSGIGAFIGLGILGSLELAPYAIMAGSSLWQRLSSIWQNIFSNPCKTVAGRSLSDVLSTQNVEIFKSFIRRISGEAMKAGGATRTLADTYRILQRAKELGYEVVTGIETKWAGGPHIHLQYPGSGKIYFPVPPGFEL